jgi:hypothetical protein
MSYLSYNVHCTWADFLTFWVLQILLRKETLSQLKAWHTGWRTLPECTLQYRSKHSYPENNNQDNDDDIDVYKEKRTQSYIITMITLFAICWCPLNILILVQYFVHENGDNSGHFDITYITFIWFGFLSTCTNMYHLHTLRHMSYVYL